MKSLRVAATQEEIGLFKWAAARRHGRTFDAFVLETMLAQTRATVREMAAAGKPVPQWVAELLERMK